MSNNKDAQSSYERELEYWTAPPIKYGLPFMIATFIICNIWALKLYLFDAKPYEWGFLAFLLSGMVCAVYVHRKVEHLRGILNRK